jgi:hypothetical protein
VLAYSTPDFAAWTYAGVALPPSARRNGTEFRPQVVFNGSHYLMWYEDRWSAGGANPGYAVAAALGPAGPFATEAPSVKLGGRGRVGDYDIFVDAADGNRAYHVRTGLTIQPLNAAMNGPEGAAIDVPNGGVEGPAVFRRGDFYYLLVGVGCCACRGGSNVVPYTARAMAGPWARQRDVGSNSTSGHVFSAHSPYNYVTRAQGTKVVVVPSPSGGPDQYLWVGNQWVTSAQPGRERNSDLLFWALLEFAEDGNITQMAWADTATLDV